jgi:hypothetical protein
MQKYEALVKLKGVELEFVEARTAVIVGSGTDRQRIAQLRRVEDEYCRRLANEPRLKLEVERRIAETLLDMSISRGRRIANCRARLNALAKLGFANIEQKAHWHLMYARAALERGHPQTASNIATGMVIELRRSLRHRRSLLGCELLGHFEQLATRSLNVVRS